MQKSQYSRRIEKIGIPEEGVELFARFLNVFSI